MYKKLTFVLVFCICFISGGATADSDFLMKFKNDYSTLDLDLLNNDIETATIKDFVYQKDAATFTFKEGTIYLLRYVNDRPTTAIFLGQGHAKIDVPLPTERNGLLKISGDSLVDENFELLFMRLGDDFDLKIKEKFSFTTTQLDWKDFTITKEAQGEFFFKPNIRHPHDNYFQLLRSIYERSDDGYFWADFNRYVFSFDPNRAEEVEVAFEFEGGDIVTTTASKFQRMGKNKTDNSQLSEMQYCATAISKHGNIVMGGNDGRRIESCEGILEFVVNQDSLKFISSFLQYNLNLDSIILNDQQVDFMRRKTFKFVGVILPEYFYKGDTVKLSFWYEGANFDHFMPYLENPAPCLYSFNFTVPKGCNYYMPGMSTVMELDKKHDQFTVASPLQYNNFFFHLYYGGVEDTIGVMSDLGLTLNFLKVKHIKKRTPCFIAHEKYRQSVTDAFNYFAEQFGPPPNTFVEYIIPEGFQSMPGMIKVPQIACVTEGGWDALGGIDLISGNSVVRQWMGSNMRPATNREKWFMDVLPEYLTLMFLQSNQEPVKYYTNLYNRRDSLYTAHDRDRDIPLVSGPRVNGLTDEENRSDFIRSIQSNKGVWVMHMLRFLMFDLETQSEATFIKFLRKLYLLVNNKLFTNGDFIALAEKYYGDSLTPFFDQWFYGVDFPQFKVDYSIEKRDGQFFIPLDVNTVGAAGTFQMPVIMRVGDKEGGSQFLREVIKAGSNSLELGPFAKEPKELIFNEFFSVLSKDNVKKK